MNEESRLITLAEQLDYQRSQHPRNHKVMGKLKYLIRKECHEIRKRKEMELLERERKAAMN